MKYNKMVKITILVYNNLIILIILNNKINKLEIILMLILQHLI